MRAALRRVRVRGGVRVRVRVRPGCGLLSGRVAAMGAEGHEKSWMGWRVRVRVEG